MNISIKIEQGEYWWGGSSAESTMLPLSSASDGYFLDMSDCYNQTMPFYLSSHGRYVYSEEPMTVKASGGVINFSSCGEITVEKCGETLRDAYLAASKRHFPFTGKFPPLDFFRTAQYNTWMEYDYNPTQEGVLKYARAIVDNGYTPGIIIIDEGWHTRYGLWEFDLAKFPDPKGMVDELHSLGFKVMLWVVPMVTADGRDFVISCFNDRMHLAGGAKGKKYFLRNDQGDVALYKWWEGFSAILDMHNPDDREFLDTKLRRLMNEYGVDGFKFDGGNVCAYNSARLINGTQTTYTPNELNIAWNDFGARYEYHEYKDTYKGGGKPVVQRIRDRNHKWKADEDGIESIIPAALNQGLIGHPFICPDMIGGGEWSFNYLDGFCVDEELFVRMAQCSALFPMMQFSWAPWRMLGEKSQELCLEAEKLHLKFSDYIEKLVKESAVSGEPILRHLEYEFPHKGYERINDQFMLGGEILVAPVVTKGEITRTLALPEGNWLYLGETEYEGGKTVTVDAPISVLPYFIKI